MRSDHRSFALDDLKATRKRQSCHQLVTEDWNITLLTGKEHELVEEVKRYFLMWLVLENQGTGFPRLMFRLH